MEDTPNPETVRTEGGDESHKDRREDEILYCEADAAKGINMINDGVLGFTQKKCVLLTID